MPATVSPRTPPKKTSAKRNAVAPESLAKAALQRDRARNPLSRALGANIKALRIAKDWSQEQLAGEAEMDRSAISLIELGKTNATIFSLSVLASVLDVTLSRLFEPITFEMNLKPSWEDSKGIKRRANRATPERKETPSRRLR
jgi:transcriptional regulator with XRE-family HTH domain